MGIAQRESVPISVVNESAKQRFAVNLRYWQLCEELTIYQAALLILGEDPEEAFFDGEISGYKPLVAAIVAAAESNTIVGKGRYKWAVQEDGTFKRTDETDPCRSTVRVDSLKEWLCTQGLRPAVLFPEKSDDQRDNPLPSYSSKTHPRFAPKLGAAVQAWEAMKDPANLDLGRTPRQALEAWLIKNADRLGLVAKNGKPIKQAIKEVAKIANWQSQGGAPRTGGNPTTR